MCVKNQGKRWGVWRCILFSCLIRLSHFVAPESKVLYFADLRETHPAFKYFSLGLSKVKLQRFGPNSSLLQLHKPLFCGASQIDSFWYCLLKFKYVIMLVLLQQIIEGYTVLQWCHRKLFASVHSNVSVFYKTY